MKLPITITTSESDRKLLKRFDVHEYNLMMTPADINDMNGSIAFIKSLNARCVSIHSPFINKTAMNFEDYIVEPELYLKVVEYAKRVALVMHTQLPLVFHTNLTYNTKKFIPFFADKMRPMFASSLIICLENTTDVPLAGESLKNDYRAIPDIVGTFKVCLPDVSIGTCLDVCHATILCRYIAERKAIGSYDASLRTFSDYSRAHGSDCRLIHLANTVAHGLNRSYHGQAFDPNKRSDVKALSTIMNNISTFNKNATVVLEVSDENYNDRPNVAITLECLKRYF